MRQSETHSNHEQPYTVPDFPALVTIPEIARALKLHKVTVRRLLGEKQLPGVKVGGHWRMRRGDLLNILQPSSESAAA
jgi:excisionase family DNA binding protein